MRNTEIRLHVRAQGKLSPTATLIDHGELSARRKRSRNGHLGSLGPRSRGWEVWDSENSAMVHEVGDNVNKSSTDWDRRNRYSSSSRVRFS